MTQAVSQKPAGHVRHEVHGHILKIIIDNTAKKNAFTPEMTYQLSDALTILDRKDDLRVGVICAAGADFTAGLDMPKFFGPDAQHWGHREGTIDIFAMKNRCRKPVISAVQGYVYTIGIEVMLAGDIVIASDDCKFSQLEAKRGIAPLGGAHFRFLSRAGWGDAMYHLMLCDQFDAERARKIGLVQEVVPAGQQIDRAMELAKLITMNAPLGVQVTKEAALAYTAAGEAAAIDYIDIMRARVVDSEDAKEGVRSFIERRVANFQGR